MGVSTRTWANCTSATTVAITMASENAITVSGRVILSPGSSILGKESSNMFHSLSVMLASSFCNGFSTEKV